MKRGVPVSAAQIWSGFPCSQFRTWRDGLRVVPKSQI